MKLSVSCRIKVNEGNLLMCFLANQLNCCTFYTGHIIAGVYNYLIYGILAVAHEASILVLQGSPQNPVGLVCAFPLGAFWVEMPVPILRSVLAFMYASAIACGLALLRSRKIYQDDLASEARRRER